jgi:hypothetical protein
LSTFRKRKGEREEEKEEDLRRIEQVPKLLAEVSKNRNHKEEGNGYNEHYPMHLDPF